MTKRHKMCHAGKVEDFRVDTFLEAIAEVYKTYGLSLSAGSGHFTVVPLADAYVNWLQKATIAANVELGSPAEAAVPCAG